MLAQDSKEIHLQAIDVAMLATMFVAVFLVRRFFHKRHEREMGGQYVPLNFLAFSGMYYVPVFMNFISIGIMLSAADTGATGIIEGTVIKLLIISTNTMALLTGEMQIERKPQF